MNDKGDIGSRTFETLKLPEMTPWGFAKHFGPGMILMMTGIGTSHLITAPVAGGRFEFALLWCVPMAYVFKYYGFEMAIRFTNATGRSILDAYSTAWRKWPLWYVLVTTLLQCAVGQAGRLIAASAVVYYLFTQVLSVELPMSVIGFALGLLSVVIILSGRYPAIETVTKITSGMLFVSTVGVYLVQPAPFSAMGHFFLVEVPSGSWLVLAAFLGLLPTGIDVSLQASEWGKAKRVGLGRIRNQLESLGLAPKFDPWSSTKADLTVDTTRLPAHVREYCRRWFVIGLWDFRAGHTVSFLIACVFLLLAAVWLYPSDVSGRAVIGEIAGIFSSSVGSWMTIVFVAGAFAATFSTAFNYFDGWPRVVGACCRNLFHSTAKLTGTAREDIGPEHRRRWYSEYNIYRATMVYSLLAAVAIIAGFPRPVWLVLVASALAFFVAPVIYALNLYYCFTVIPRTDGHFYPSGLAMWFSWVSLVVFTGMTALAILDRVFGVALIGA
jgi:Mn2+/Fe2+ NRAMP family transporter